MSVGAVIGAVVPAALSAAGVTASAIANKKANRENLRIQEEQYAKERNAAMEQRRFDQMYNDPSAIVNRLRRAGLNPQSDNVDSAMFGSTSPQSASVEPAKFQPFDFSAGMNAAASTAVQGSQLSSDLELKSAQVANYKAMTSKTMNDISMDVAHLDLDSRETDARIESYCAQAGLSRVQTEKVKMDTQNIKFEQDLKTKVFELEKAKNDADIKKIKSDIYNSTKDACTRRLQYFLDNTRFWHLDRQKSAAELAKIKADIRNIDSSIERNGFEQVYLEFKKRLEDAHMRNEDIETALSPLRALGSLLPVAK